MNRQQFADTVAEAYTAQYPSPGENPVMGMPVVYYDPDTERFSWCSSLSNPDGWIVLVVEEGMFGSDDEACDGEAIVAFLVDPASDDLWNEVVNTINTAVYGSEDEDE